MFAFCLLYIFLSSNISTVTMFLSFPLFNAATLKVPIDLWLSGVKLNIKQTACEQKFVHFILRRMSVEVATLS